MSYDPDAKVPTCPDCKSRNCRFNMTRQAFVCNRCGRTGTKEEFGMEKKKE